MKRMWRLVAWVAGLAALVVVVTPLLNTSLTNKPKDGGLRATRAPRPAGTAADAAAVTMAVRSPC